MALDRLQAMAPAVESISLVVAWFGNDLRAGNVFFDPKSSESFTPYFSRGWRDDAILDALRQEGVDIAVTYGDPAFYGRVGFKPVSEADLPAPQPLGQPQGWIAQSLTDAPLTPLRGPARCVAAFDDPALW